MVTQRPCSTAQPPADSPDSTVLEASQSNRPLTNPLTWYQACPYERRFMAFPPSIIHPQCQFLRTHNGYDYRARTSNRPFQNHAQVGLRVHRIVISQLGLVLTNKILFPVSIYKRWPSIT